MILEALGRAPRGRTPSQSGLRAGVVILENNLLTNYVLCELCFGYELGLCPFGLFWSTVLGLCPFVSVLVAVLGCYVLWGLFLVVGDDVGVQF